MCCGHGSQGCLEMRRSLRVLEERAEDVMHSGRMGGVVGLKLFERSRSISSVIAHADSASFQFVHLIRQRVCLQIVDHLQFMLDVPEKLIRAGETALLFR